MFYFSVQNRLICEISWNKNETKNPTLSLLHQAKGECWSMLDESFVLFLKRTVQLLACFVCEDLNVIFHVAFLAHCQTDLGYHRKNARK